MGKQHILGALKNEKAVVYALCDSAPERLKAAADEFKPQVAVTDYRELVNDPELDAVILVVPDQIHKRILCFPLKWSMWLWHKARNRNRNGNRLA